MLLRLMMMMYGLFRVCKTMLNQEVLYGVPIPALMRSTHAVDVVADRFSFVVEYRLECFQSGVSGAKDRLPYCNAGISNKILVKQEEICFKG